MDCVRHCWDVLAGIAFTSDVKLILLKIRKQRKKLIQCTVQIFSNIDFVSSVALVLINKTEASSNWIINVQQIVV